MNSAGQSAVSGRSGSGWGPYSNHTSTSHSGRTNIQGYIFSRKINFLTFLKNIFFPQDIYDHSLKWGKSMILGEINDFSGNQ